MTKEKIVKEYFKMATRLSNEKQFNKKVDLNIQINKFKKTHNLTMKVNDPITTLFINDKEIATIRKQYSSRKINLEYKELKKRLLVMT